MLIILFVLQATSSSEVTPVFGKLIEKGSELQKIAQVILVRSASQAWQVLQGYYNY